MPKHNSWKAKFKSFKKMRSKGKDLAPKKISNTQENEWAAYL